MRRGRAGSGLACLTLIRGRGRIQLDVPAARAAMGLDGVDVAALEVEPEPKGTLRLALDPLGGVGSRVAPTVENETLILLATALRALSRHFFPPAPTVSPAGAFSNT